MIQLLYHATTESSLEAILKEGSITTSHNNNRNKFKNDPDYAACFTRNFRYATTGKDDDGNNITGIEDSNVVLIFDRNIMNSNYKIELVSHATMTINAIDFLKKHHSKFRETKILTDKNTRELKDALSLVIEDLSITLNKEKKTFTTKIKEYSENHQFQLNEEDLIFPRKAFIKIAQQLSPENFTSFLQDIEKDICQPKHKQALESEEIVKTKHNLVKLDKLGFVGWTYPKEKWVQKHPNENFEDWLKTLPQYMQNTYINSPTTLDNTLSNIEKMRAKTIPSTLKRTTPP